ncbi:hypothetical protein [Cupriavidus pauculus]|uniref:hypothetical protein n=1 Tax=Cupriavidus pauculus TaxID=82633 RepID=UPI001246E752|nr:hypothetical protein [Cupriavidus pauculus]KAB0601037.1 hypothetical protein F7R19_18345 [Cupriavidus pauculus]UAL01967.1 hypothetical protein K8O84_24440 [Cupriavidus pauculus]
MTVIDTFETNTFGFNLPCRQFVIAAERTRERRLPMVDEFVLRTLHVVQTIKAARLARFFGFEGQDLGIVISDLQTRGLVVVDGDNLTLHASARELFRTSDGTTPTITVAEPMHADVWFDLVTKHMVSGRGLRNVQHLVSLPAMQAMTESEARTAFHDNFRDYLRIARSDKNADQWNLYSILDVHPGRYSFVQIGGNEVLKLDPVPKLESRLQLEDYDRGARTRRLTEAMIVELAKRDEASPSQVALNDFVRLVGKEDLGRWMRSDATFDVADWYSYELRSGADITIPLVGYPYVERNRKAIAQLLDEVTLDLGKDDRCELHWLRPGGARWGATEDLPSTLESLRAIVRARTKGGSISTALVSPAAVGGKESLLFQRIFDRGLLAPAGKSPIALEILIVPGALAVVSVMMPLTQSVHVPIGYVTIDEVAVKRIMHLSRMQALVNEGERLWPRSERV